MSIQLTKIKGMDRRYPYGVMVERKLLKLEVIGEYKGVRMTSQELNVKYPAEDSRYAFQFKDRSYLDADDPTAGNITRFINGAGADDEPNVTVHEVNGRITFITTREVEIGEELLYDYGKAYKWSKGEQKSLKNNETSTPSFKSNPGVKLPVQEDWIPDETKTQPQAVDDSTTSPEFPKIPGLLMQRFLPASFKLEELDVDSSVVYTDTESGDVPEGWSVATVTGIYPDDDLIECHRLGSMLYSKTNSRLAESTWKLRWRDPKDGKDVLSDVPPARVKDHAVIEWIKPSQLIAHGFFLTNRGKIEKTVVDIIQLWCSQET
jgi:hypothetical protein